MDDPFDLERFVDAQAGVYETARAELAAGRKRSHWMWFVFPQIRGLGSSPMSERYGVASLAEAEAYLRHRVLGPRLTECVRLALATTARSASDIFAFPDDLKFHSCVTLFALAAPEWPVFGEALERFFDGALDAATVTRIGGRSARS